MGIKYASIMLVILLILSGVSAVLNSSAITGEDENDHLNSLTKDNNNSFSSAVLLTSGNPVKDSVSIDDDMFDFYKVNLQCIERFNIGDRMTIDFRVDQTSGQARIFLFNPEMYQIGYEECKAGFINPITRDIFAISTGTYYIAVQARSLEPQIKYEINVTYGPRLLTIDGDNTNNTASLAIHGGLYQKTINPVTDYLDLYNITLTAGQDSTEGLTVELLDKNDKYLAVYKPDGTLRNFSDRTFFDEGENEVIKIAADQTGIYRIAVGISGAPMGQFLYILSTNITTGIPPDDDHSEEFATRVYDNTRLEKRFGSEFDVYDYFKIKLNQSDNLTVSIKYKDSAKGDLNLTIYSEGSDKINVKPFYDEDKGVWTWGIAETNDTDYYIRVENLDLSRLLNYSIYFSLSGLNLWYWDDPMVSNQTALEFSMLEDTADQSHVNLSEIFYDPDSPITFSSPSHPTGIGENIDMQILANGIVKFIPHNNFFGFEVFNFSATDINTNKLYCEVNVTVLPVNDRPVVGMINDQFWAQDVAVNLTISVSDVDNTAFTITDNTTLFEVNNTNSRIEFTPGNDQVGVYFIKITVNDGTDNTSISFTARINNTNDAPEITRIGGKAPVPGGLVKFDANEDRWNNFTVEVKDIDHEIGAMDVLQFYDNITDPAFNINTTTGNVSFFPEQKHVGTFYAMIKVEDGFGGSAVQNISIAVKNVNDAPEIPEIIVMNKSGLTVNCTVLEVVDEDGDNLTYTWDFGDGSGTNVTGRYGNHTYSKSGNYTIKVSVSDGNGGESNNTYLINVTSSTGDDNGGENGNDTNDKPMIDIDEDGLDDDWEKLHFGNLTQGPNDDFDNDGFSNLLEFENETDPTKPTDRPFIKKDDSQDDDSTFWDGEFLIMITALILNFILVLIVIALLVKRRRSRRDGARGESRVEGGRHDKFTYPCPECGRSVAEDAMRCQYCGEYLDMDLDLDPDYAEEDGRYRDQRAGAWDSRSREYEDYNYMAGVGGGGDSGRRIRSRQRPGPRQGPSRYGRGMEAEVEDYDNMYGEPEYEVEPEYYDDDEDWGGAEEPDHGQEESEDYYVEDDDVDADTDDYWEEEEEVEDEEAYNEELNEEDEEEDYEYDVDFEEEDDWDEYEPEEEED